MAKKMNEYDYRIRLAEETIEQEELVALCDWIKTRGQLTKGELTSKFEQHFKTYIGSPYCIFVNSGSSANLLILYALYVSGLMRNGKVVAPAVSWATTVAPPRACPERARRTCGPGCVAATPSSSRRTCLGRCSFPGDRDRDACTEPWSCWGSWLGFLERRLGARVGWRWLGWRA